MQNFKTNWKLRLLLSGKQGFSFAAGIRDQGLAKPNTIRHGLHGFNGFPRIKKQHSGGVCAAKTFI